MKAMAMAMEKVPKVLLPFPKLGTTLAGRPNRPLHTAYTSD